MTDDENKIENTETKETDPETSSGQTKKSSNTTIYLVLAIVVLLVGGGAVWAVKNLNRPEAPAQIIGTETQKPRGPVSMKGQKLSDTNLADQAVQIYPGEISPSAKAIMSGWNLKTKTLPDLTTQADLIPVGSEATEGDTSHTYNLKTGDKLYFADINPNDDGSTEDRNTNDDMGIVVDSNGIIQ